MVWLHLKILGHGEDNSAGDIERSKEIPVLPLTGFTFLNLFGLLECLVMWLISMPVIKV